MIGGAQPYLLYRTYHGCAMSPRLPRRARCGVQDESHVVENRRLVSRQIDTAIGILKDKIDVEMPDAAFYLWVQTHCRTRFTRQLYEAQAVSRAARQLSRAPTRTARTPHQPRPHRARPLHGNAPSRRDAYASSFPSCPLAAADD